LAGVQDRGRAARHGTAGVTYAVLSSPSQPLERGVAQEAIARSRAASSGRSYCRAATGFARQRARIASIPPGYSSAVRVDLARAARRALYALSDVRNGVVVVQRSLAPALTTVDPEQAILRIRSAR
jgi:hypothetical protein